MNKPTIKQSIIGGAIFASGGFVGWVSANKFLAKKYAAMLDAAVDDVKSYYAATHNKLVFPTPGDAVEALIPVKEREGLERLDEAIKDFDTRTTEIPDDLITVKDTRQRIFEQDESDKVDVVPTPRNADRPYVITVGEFMENDLGYEQIVIEYYEGDNSLCDEQESLIPDVEYTIGEESLNHFGEVSGDPDTLYVRNEKLETDFEVTRHEGSYSVEVLGIDPQLIEEPARPRTRKKSERDN